MGRNPAQKDINRILKMNELIVRSLTAVISGESQQQPYELSNDNCLHSYQPKRGDMCIHCKEPYDPEA